jgi:hypothetical protein
MKKFILFLPFILLVSCTPVECPFSNINNTEPTLQAAEDANKKEFSEESFR